MDDPLAFGIDLDEARTRAEALGYFLSVTDILEAAEALDETIPARPPAAFVAVSSERADPNRLIGGHRQRVNFELTMLFVESAARLDRKSRDQLDRTRRAVIRQFIAWKPSRVDAGLEYSGFRVVSVGNGLVWGECRFGGSYQLSTAA